VGRAVVDDLWRQDVIFQGMQRSFFVSVSFVPSSVLRRLVGLVCVIKGRRVCLLLNHFPWTHSVPCSLR